MTNQLQTPRLILRQWQDSDTAPFIQMCADDDVMRYFLKKLSAEEATAFRNLRLEKVISFTASLNTPSERVMQRIGMEKVREFNHPLVPADHPLNRHVLYEIQRSDYLHIPFC